MIYIANKTREIEKSNTNLKISISKINEDIKINKIEFVSHQNSSYLKKMYSLYYSENIKNNLAQIITVKQISNQKENIKLITTKN